MYFAQSPACVLRSIVPAPVNAPKNSVLASPATGAARTIVGVPTLPRNERTAFGPRASPVDEMIVLPGTTGVFVVGHLGAVCSAWTSVNARAFASARSGW